MSSGPPPQPPEPPGDDAQFYWEWARHEECLFTERGSFFLVGQSMLFAGVASLRAVEHTGAAAALPVFYGIGIFLCAVWLWVNAIQHFKTRRPLWKKLYQHEPRRRVESAVLKGLWAKGHFWMGVVVPAGLIVGWVLLWLQ